jgi:hypothetical protein
MPYEGMSEEKFRAIIPISEIQRYEGNCWATTLSMLLRTHGFDISQKYVTDLFREWRYEGVTSSQMNALVGYFNKNLLSKKGWIAKTTDNWSGLVSDLGQFGPIQVFITGHFVLVLGSDGDEITYFDPWNGSVLTVNELTFKGYGGGESVYMYKE